MVNNGIDIGLAEFKRMKSLDRDILIYNNLVHIRKRIGDYQFHKKIQYAWLVVLTIAFGFRRFMGI